MSRMTRLEYLERAYEAGFKNGKLIRMQQIELDVVGKQLPDVYSSLKEEIRTLTSERDDAIREHNEAFFARKVAGKKLDEALEENADLRRRADVVSRDLPPWLEECPEISSSDARALYVINHARRLFRGALTGPISVLGSLSDRGLVTIHDGLPRPTKLGRRTLRKYMVDLAADMAP
jgi:hypothetical protein